MIHLRAKNQTGKVIAMPLRELYCHARIENSEFLDKIADSIEEHGLQNPIVVCPITIQRWRDMKRTTSEILDPPDLLFDDVVFQVRCGNNRVRAARALGYETIDCVVYESLREASTECNRQRTQQNQWRDEQQYGEW